MTPGPRRDGGAELHSRGAWRTFGMSVNVWGEEFLRGSQNPKATCFKFEVPLGKKSGDSCEDSYSEKTTQYIRVTTAYGVCGATYRFEDNFVKRYLTNNTTQTDVVGEAGCTIMQ